MFETFLLSFKLRITYMANSFIYSLKHLPLIGKEISDEMYSSKGFKRFSYIIASIFGLIWDVFLKKALYVLIMGIAIPAFIYSIKDETGELATFPLLTVLTFLTIIGGISNNDLFQISQDKYYAIFTMRMNTKKYILTNYISYLFKTLVGMLLVLFLFKLDLELGKLTTFLIPIYIVFVKLFFSGVDIKRFKAKGTLNNDKIYNWIKTIINPLLFITANTLPLLNINITNEAFYIIFVISSILGSWGLREILIFNQYKRAYKILNHEYKNEFQFKYDEKAVATQAKEQSLKSIDINVKYDSDKEGYQFFNELFEKRHRGILEKTAKIESIIITFIIILASVIIFISKNGETKSSINGFLLNSLPIFTFIMYFLNRGTDVTKAMYMNCDHSMLTYKFFKKPDAIVGLFKQRLKTLVRVNLVPSTTLAIGLPILLFISGGTDNILNYFILFISIIAMSVFFSTHYLVIYYFCNHIILNQN